MIDDSKWPYNVVALEYPHVFEFKFTRLKRFREMRQWCSDHFADDEWMGVVFPTGEAVVMIKREDHAVWFSLKWV